MSTKRFSPIMVPANGAMRRRNPVMTMADFQNTSVVHDKHWMALEGSGHFWRDPLNRTKLTLALCAMKPLGLPDAVRILDYGCGDGICTDLFAERFHRRGYQACGIDISKTAITRNRERFPHLEFQLVQPDQPAPYPDGTFDVIFSAEVIEHVYDVHFVFSEFVRLLRPGGLLIMTTPYHGIVKNILIALFYFERHFDPTWQHIRFWTKQSLSNVCTAHGLSPVLWRYIGRLWPVSKSLFVVCRKDV